MKLAIRRLDSRQGAKHAKFRREKINYLEKIVYYYFRSLRPLRRVSGHAWCPFAVAQGMLCGRYSEFQLWLCRAKTPTMAIHRISYQQHETLHFRISAVRFHGLDGEEIFPSSHRRNARIHISRKTNSSVKGDPHVFTAYSYGRSCRCFGGEFECCIRTIRRH